MADFFQRYTNIQLLGVVDKFLVTQIPYTFPIQNFCLRSFLGHPYQRANNTNIDIDIDIESATDIEFGCAIVIDI